MDARHRRLGAADPLTLDDARPSRWFWPWLLQRVTGVALLALLIVHLGVDQFGNLGKDLRHTDLILFGDVASRLARALWWLVDAALLAGALFHGLNGMRNIALDLGVRGRIAGVVTALLTVVGLIGLTFGLLTLYAFRHYPVHHGRGAALAAHTGSPAR